MVERRARSDRVDGTIVDGSGNGWPLSVLAALALLLAPAVWNGFPLLQWDTGGYLARWYEGYLVESRSTVYGLLLYALRAPGFWPVVVLQSAVAIWSIALMLRVNYLTRPHHLFITIALLSGLTSLPWLSAMLLTDIFAGLAVLAFYLLSFEGQKLSRPERIGLVVLIAVSVATHSATLAMVAALIAVTAASATWLTGRFDLRRVKASVCGVALGSAMLLTSNFAASGQLAWTPGGFAIVFARLVEDGIAKRYLDEHCPRGGYKLCRYKDRLPATADEFLWGGRNSVFDQLGRFSGLNAEMKAIVVGSLAAYPGWQLQAAVSATARQLVTVETGEGVLDSLAHTYGIIRRYTPEAIDEMKSARQQCGSLNIFNLVNLVHVPVALASLLALLGMLGLAWKRGRMTRLDRLGAVMATAILANAAVCAIISNPHPRYGARMAWLTPLLLAIVVLRHARSQSWFKWRGWSVGAAGGWSAAARAS